MKQKPDLPRCLLLQVITPHFHRQDALDRMAETERLVQTYGGKVVVKEVQHKVKPHPATYIGPGKLEWLIQTVANQHIDVVILNDVVKSGQLFRVEKALWQLHRSIQVWDRVGLILKIFAQHASTTEAKLQIELARITHDGPRIYGLGADELSRQGGGIGTRGLGETNIERERRVIKARQTKIQQQLRKLHDRKHKQVLYRKNQGIGPVALVGYTSAGKTSLFNRLTGKHKLQHQKLFTTLDTVVGKMKTPDSRLPVLVSDTIGFIQDLPPMLIDAFRSTLIESMAAELMLHIVDVSDDRMLEKVEVVEQILEDLDVSQPIELVFNKVDTISPKRMTQIARIYGDRSHCFVSAQTGAGCDELKRKIVTYLIDSKPVPTNQYKSLPLDQIHG